MFDFSNADAVQREAITASDSPLSFSPEIE